MLFTNIGLIDEHFTYHKNCYVGTKDRKIAYIGTEKPSENFGSEYDGTGKLLMPGLFNAHSHSAMTLMRGYAENMVLSDWLNKKIFPFEAKLDSNAIYNGTLLAAAEMLRFGIVSTTDMYFDIDATSRAVQESGIKMNFSLGMTCFSPDGIQAHPLFRKFSQALSQFKNEDGDRFRLDASLHAEYTTTPRFVEEMAAFAKENRLNMHVHLSETKLEHEQCKERRQGRSPARYFLDAGVFDVPTTAAHCIWLDEEDYDIFKEKNVTAVCCPVSNLKLASGFSKPKKMLDMGINVALGTDGVASNNNLNFWEEIKLFAILYKAVSADPTAITPLQALSAATQAGAAAQGRPDCGAIKVGNCADLIVLDLENQPHLHPCHQMLNNLVFSTVGTEVCLTMVDGQVLYRDGIYTTIDIDQVRHDTDAAIRNILKEL